MDNQPYEVTFPAPPTGNNPAPVSPPAKPKRRKAALITTAAVLVLGLAASGAYLAGYNRGQAHVAGSSSNPPQLKVPQGATIISQCAVGRGTQYVLPANIPHGPVFNVYKGNVIGIEYMIGSDDLAAATNFFNLPLYGKNYDHIDVGLVSNGHAGYPQRHYHVDVYNISRAESAAITCK